MLHKSILRFAGILMGMFSLILPGYGQGLGINTNSPDASAILDLTSTEQGILIPRMTSAQRNAISSPANGLLVYDTDQDNFYYNAGTSGSPDWQAIADGSGSSSSTTLTTIKILPSMIMATSKSNDDIKSHGYNHVSTNNGVAMSDDNTDLAAFVEIPEGYKATHVRMYGNDTNEDVEVYESNYETGTLTEVGDGEVDELIDITDVSWTATNFLVIIIEYDDKDDDILYGGYVTIAPI